MLLLLLLLFILEEEQEEKVSINGKRWIERQKVFIACSVLTMTQRVYNEHNTINSKHISSRYMYSKGDTTYQMLKCLLCSQWNWL